MKKLTVSFFILLFFVFFYSCVVWYSIFGIPIYGTWETTGEIDGTQVKMTITIEESTKKVEWKVYGLNSSTNKFELSSGVKGTMEFDEHKAEGYGKFIFDEQWDSNSNTWQGSNVEEYKIKYSLKSDTLTISIDTNKDEKIDENNIFGTENFNENTSNFDITLKLEKTS